jgi:hypothetical protein
MHHDSELMSDLERLFGTHMHELRYNEPEYERELLALMREIKTALAASGPEKLQELVERRCARLEAQGKSEFATRLGEFKKAIAPFVG